MAGRGKRKRVSVTGAIADYLETKGTRGATLDEIADHYVANADSHAEAYLGPDTDGAA